MTVTLIAKEKDKTGTEVLIHLANPIGGTPVIPFFLKNYAQLIEDGHAHPIIMGTNKSKAIYATIDNKVVGHIVFDIQEDVAKTAWIIFSCIDDNFRQRGLYKLIHKHFTVVAKTLGSTKIASHVHVTNKTRQASCESVGMKPVFYRMEHDLK